MINALRYTEDLENAGFTPKQAKATVSAWMDLMNANFATNADLKDVEYSLKSAMKDLEVNFTNRCDDLEVKFDKRCDVLEVKFDKRCDYLEAKFDKRCDGLESKIETSNTKLLLSLGSLMIALFGATIGVLPYLINK